MLNALCVVVPNVACTSATSAWPTSAAPTTYELPVASAIRPQTRPFALQRSHAYVTFAGVGLHAPVVA